MKDVRGKVALITGGASGIGLGLAQAFVEEGMKVIIVDINESHIKEATAQFERQGQSDRIHAMRVNVTDRPAMEKAATEASSVFGKLHVLVNNAGVQNPASLTKTSYEDWDRMMRVNVDGVFNGIQAFLPLIKAHGEGGHVLTTCSILGLFTIGAGYTAYCASKFAVVAMMESLRVELADSNIGVSAFCPGMVKSNLEKWLKDAPMAADPVEIGRLVLRGIRNNDLYILTHPEFAPVFQSRQNALEASLLVDRKPSQDKIDGVRKLESASVYAKERDRLKCERTAAIRSSRSSSGG